jgi:C1A family cysteine protease
MEHKFNLIIERKVMPKLSLEHVSVTASCIDYRPRFKTIYNQGSIGSCTANAFCYAYNFNDPSFDPSRLFLYYNTRLLDNDNHISIDDGSTMTQGINALKKFGISSEKLWPYIISKFATKPTVAAYKDGLQHQVISAIYMNQKLNTLKACIQSRQPFVCGIMVYESFLSNNVTTTGNVPMPNVNTENLLGGHAITCVGYDDSRQVFIMLNSWGKSWGVNGSFYLPYAYLTNTNLAGDFWKITKLEKIPVKKPGVNKNKKIFILKSFEKQKHKLDIQ